MTQFSAFGTHGNGTTGPGTSISFGAAFVSGLTFKVTSPGQFLYGYYYWRSDSAQSASAQGALWALTANTTGTFQTGTSASTTTMVAGQWNFIALATPFALTSGTVYRAVIGVTGNFNDVHSQFGTAGPYVAGIVSGPLTVYSAPVGQGGTNEAPFTNVFQGTFGTSGSDPTANLPASDDSSANFFVDILVGPATATAASAPALSQAVRARRQLNYPLAGSVSAEIGPGTGNISGPLQGAGFGSGMGASGSHPKNPVQGPVFRSLHWPVQAQDPLAQQRISGAPGPRGRVYGLSRGAPVHNPAPPVTGPVFRPLTSPARIRPALPPRGRVAANPGAFVRNPQSGALISPAGQPAGRIVVVVRTGLAMSSVIPLPAPPSTAGPAFFPLAQARRARQPLPARGRTYYGPGAPARNPSAGPVFIPDTRVQAQRPSAVPPIRGRISSSSGVKALFFPLGPAFVQAGSPSRARILPQLRGRILSGPGGPVSNPPPPVFGPVFRQATSPARTRPALPGKGRTGSNPGAPLRNPHSGGAFPSLQNPVRAHVPQVFSKGRICSGSGAPVRNPVFPSPLYPLKAPVRAVLPLPARGRVAFSPGGPVANPVTHSGPPFYPLRFPVRTRIIPPPRGRVSFNPGIAARNPHQGARFVSAVHPIRALIPQNAPRGRIASGQGGPVQNIPFGLILFEEGLPGKGWRTGTPVSGNIFTGSPQSGWTSGSALVSAVVSGP